MKRLIGLSIFLVLVFYAYGQYNTELIDTTKCWSTADVYTGGGGNKYSFFNKFGSDTLINNQSYTKIYRAFDEFMTEWELHGFIRKAENKYYLRNLANEVGLAYDFNVNVGDTLFIDNPFAFYPFQAEVMEIDSVYIEPASEYRKRIKLIGPFSNSNYIESWIEGIGSDAGIVYSGCHMAPFTGYAIYTLLCYYESGQLIYKNQNYPVCFYPIVNIEKIIDETYNFFVFPNPVTGISQLSVQYPKNRKLTIKIFNPTGALLEEHKITTSKNIYINSANYSQGIYFYSVLEENKCIHSGKFIIR